MPGRRSFKAAFKLSVCQYAEEFGNRAVIRRMARGNHQGDPKKEGHKREDCEVAIIGGETGRVGTQKAEGGWRGRFIYRLLRYSIFSRSV